MSQINLFENALPKQLFRRLVRAVNSVGKERMEDMVSDWERIKPILSGAVPWIIASNRSVLARSANTRLQEAFTRGGRGRLSSSRGSGLSRATTPSPHQILPVETTINAEFSVPKLPPKSASPF